MSALFESLRANAYWIVPLFVSGLYTLFTWRLLKQARISREVETFLEFVDRIEKTRPDRAFVRECIKSGGTWATLNAVSELPKVDNLCRLFDTLGLFDRLGL